MGSNPIMSAVPPCLVWVSNKARRFALQMGLISEATSQVCDALPLR